MNPTPAFRPRPPGATPPQQVTSSQALSLVGRRKRRPSNHCILAELNYWFIYTKMIGLLQACLLHAEDLIYLLLSRCKQ